MKPKKLITALNLSIIAVMIFSFIYIWAIGDNYPMHTRVFFESVKPTSVDVAINDENVVRSGDIYYDNDELTVGFTAVEPGKTEITISYTMGEDDIIHENYALEVNALHTIIDRSFGILNFNGFSVVILAILIQLLLTECIMILLFVYYRKNSEFSYPMIACGGIAIYVLVLLPYIIHYLIDGGLFSFSYFVFLVTNAGMLMLMVLTPLMLALSVMLSVSNIWLMRHEGYRPVNMLGIVFAVLWFIGALLTVGVTFDPYLSGLPVFDIFLIPCVYVIGYMECMFISTVVCSFLAVKYKPPYDRDYIIILGCAIRSDGSLTPLLKGRVDIAVAFEHAQYEATGKHAVFVPSGGQGSDEIISEGEAMERYLLENGIPVEQIAREDKSVNTNENMQFSKAVIDAHSGGKDCKIAFATTNYHVFRGYILAKKNGFDAKGISARTKLYFFPNAFLREFIGLLVDQKWRHLIYIALTTVFFIILRSI